MFGTTEFHKGKHILVVAIVAIAVGRAAVIVTPISHDAFAGMKVLVRKKSDCSCVRKIKGAAKKSDESI